MHGAPPPGRAALGMEAGMAFQAGVKREAGASSAGGGEAKRARPDRRQGGGAGDGARGGDSPPPEGETRAKVRYDVDAQDSLFE